MYLDGPNMVDAYESGRKEERAAIVAWLRGVSAEFRGRAEIAYSAGGDDSQSGHALAACARITRDRANEIEAGDHEKGGW